MSAPLPPPTLSSVAGGLKQGRGIDGDPAVSMRFSVKIEKIDLGLFSSCDGLGAEVVMEQREEGGNNSFVHHLPVRIKYPNIKLTRPIDADSINVARWFASMHGDIKPTTGEIAVLQGDDKTPIITWSIKGIIPIKWTGPSLNAETNKGAIESLELAHTGFVGGLNG